MCGVHGGCRAAQNKFCPNCRESIELPTDRVRALTTEMRTLYQANSLSAGFWKRAPEELGGGDFRVVNNTMGCTGPAIVVFRCAPPDLAWEEMPAGWIQDGVIPVSVGKGTLVPSSRRVSASNGGARPRSTRPSGAPEMLPLEELASLRAAALAARYACAAVLASSPSGFVAGMKRAPAPTPPGNTLRPPPLPRARATYSCPPYPCPLLPSPHTCTRSILCASACASAVLALRLCGRVGAGAFAGSQLELMAERYVRDAKQIDAWVAGVTAGLANGSALSGPPPDGSSAPFALAMPTDGGVAHSSQSYPPSQPSMVPVGWEPCYGAHCYTTVDPRCATDRPYTAYLPQHKPDTYPGGYVAHPPSAHPPPTMPSDAPAPMHVLRTHAPPPPGSLVSDAQCAHSQHAQPPQHPAPAGYALHYTQPPPGYHYVTAPPGYFAASTGRAPPPGHYQHLEEAPTVTHYQPAQHSAVRPPPHHHRPAAFPPPGAYEYREPDASNAAAGATDARCEYRPDDGDAGVYVCDASGVGTAAVVAAAAAAGAASDASSDGGSASETAGAEYGQPEPARRRQRVV